MAAYILRRILLIIPTMLGVMLVTFVIVQFAPGGPVERLIAQLSGTDFGATANFSGGAIKIGFPSMRKRATSIESTSSPNDWGCGPIRSCSSSA